MMPHTDQKIIPPPDPGKTGWPWEATHMHNRIVSIQEPSLWPRVTIVTPSLNQGQFLEATIRSVLLQSYPNLEYFILDGGSTDGSLEIIRKYEQHLDFWVSEPDAGQASAINRGFARASGEILGWVNSDDTYEPGAIHTVVAAFQASQQVRLVFGEGWYIDDQGEHIRPCRFIRDRFSELYLFNRDPILQPAAFWQRNLWRAVGPLDESLHWAFDWDWFIRAHKVTRFHYIPKFLANYRVQGAAKTRTGGVWRHKEVARVTRKYGRWWYPNNIVQGSRVLACLGNRLSQRLPRPIRWLVSRTFRIPQNITEFVLFGMYQN